MCDYSTEHVLELRARCLALELRLPYRFKWCPPRTLARVYNGLGPDKFPAWLRRGLTWLLRRFEAAALPHDYRYTYGPKNYWAFTVANLWLAVDCLVIAMDTPSVRRMLLDAALGLLMAFICQLGGWRGYKEAQPPDEWLPEQKREVKP